VKIFGREPALWLTLVAVIVKVVSAFVVEVSPEAQTWINTATAAAMGVIIAVAARDSVGAALLSFAQAVLALAVGFGLDWSTAQQAVVLSLVTVVVGMFDRTQVVAPAPAPPA
jgi:hypothetical protein